MKLLNLMIYVLNVIYVPFKKLKIKNRITMISRESDEVNPDFLMLKKEMEKQDPNIEVVCLCKMLKGGIISKLGYVLHMFKQMFYLATSKVIVLDTYCIVASVLKKREGTKIVQIWHSSAAIKKFGYETLDKESGSSSKIAKAMNMHGNYDYAVAPSHATGKFFARGFNIPESKIKIFGLPRLDIINDNKKMNEYEKNILEEYPKANNGKINVLYAPTFRKNKAIDLDPIIEYFDFEKYNLIVKVHPLDEFHMNSDNPGVIIDKKFPTNHWFSVCQKIISDYSAIGIESTLLHRDIYYYLYDIKEYEKTTGINIDFYGEAVKDYVAMDGRTLCMLLDEPYDQAKRVAFRDKYIETYGVNNTENLTKFLLNLR